MALFVGNAFAADGAVASRVIPNNLTNTSVDGGDTVARTTSRTTANRTTASGGRGAATGTTGATRGTASRATTTRTGATSSRGTTTRAAANATGTTKTRTTGDMNSNPAVRRAGVVLRPAFADFGGRATIAGTGGQTGSNIDGDIRKITGRATKQVQATKESIADAREKLESTAELNKSCQEQYNECMDQFCAVIDTNQKRCSCSANLSKYTKVEKAATEANKKLNEVAQAIRYVGLSADEIRAIMTETEAEEALDDTKDTSTTRNMLKQIESMIKDPTSSTTTYSSDTDFGLDMDLTFSSDPLDIFNLDFLNLGNNSASSISNLRGTELYNTAKKRCNTILTQCKDAGATQTQITGNYDLAIDKDCIAYEAGLKKMNETLVSNVSSANLMLQKARLAVLQNKNQYDARGCVSALENCMRDDMVCGDNYYKCVDPTKTYIDENGDVVLGQDITVIQSFMTNYNNASIDATFLGDAYGNTTIGKNTCDGDGKCVVKYIMQKIGTKQKSTDEGLCRPVLDKCQYYTYKDNKYQPYNDIVVNYVQRAMVNIRAAQQKIISEYASTCLEDVATCYNSQMTQINSWASSASASNIYSVLRGACRSVALTCGFALFTGEPIIESHTELTVDGKKYHVDDCPAAANETYGTAAYNDGLINCVSDMFYQSLLCPDNSTFDFDGGTHTIATNGTTGNEAWVNTKCRCNAGYDVWSGKCLASCGDDQTRGTSGSCVCTDSSQTIKNGVCVASTSSGGGSSGGGSGSGGGSSGGGSGSGGGTTPTTTYTVSYNCNGGSGSITSSQVTAGQSVTLPAANKCSKTDDTLIGWTCGEGTYNPGGSYAPDASVTCFAKWQSSTGSNKCTVSYLCGSAGTNSGSYTSIPPVSYTYGTTITLAGTPTNCQQYKDGQTFVGWYCDNETTLRNGGSNYTVPSKSKVDCEAVWSTSTNPDNPTQTYTVSYNCGEGSTGTISDENCTAGEVFNLHNVSDCGSREGYTLNTTGWDSILVTTYQCSGPETFTAQWTKNSNTTCDYTITYQCDLGGQYGTPPDPDGGHCENEEIILSDQGGCFRAGYSFGGWYSCGAAGATYTVTGNKTCRAIWVKDGVDLNSAASAQAQADAINDAAPESDATVADVNENWALIETSDDISLLYSVDNGEVSGFAGAVDSDVDIDSLESQ